MSAPADLGSVIATVAAAFPLTAQRAAANAAVLDQEAAEFERAHPDLCNATQRNECSQIS